MSDEEPFFIARNGAIWACWLSGKPAINLGLEAQVFAAMKQFVTQQDPGLGDLPATTLAPSPVSYTELVEPTDAGEPQEPRAQHARIDERHELTIIGKIYTGQGSRDVTILDLSESGCRFHDRFGTLAAETPLTIKIGPVGPVAARVKWRRKEYVGLQFDSALDPAVLEHIRDHFDLRNG
jgi:hypothetical protein